MHRQIRQHSEQVALDNELQSAGACPLPLDLLERQSQSNFNRRITGAARQPKYSKQSDGFFYALRLMQNTNPECSVSSGVAARQTATHDELEMNTVSSTQFVSCRNTQQVHQEADPACCTHNSRLGEDEIVDFTCNSCQQTFTSKYAHFMHVCNDTDTVNQPLHICKVCGDFFSAQCSLNSHSKIEEIECVVAKKGHRCLDTMKKRAHCSLPQNRLRPGDKVETAQKPALSRTDNYIPQTESSDHNNCNDSSQQSISKDSILLNSKHSETGKETNVCHICNKSFRSPYCLKKHGVVHAIHTQFKCNKCDRSFVKFGSLKRHKLMLHKEERPYKCDVCSKSFTDSGVLKRHTLVHTGGRAYKCGECGKSFKEIADLNQHSMSHTGEEPYVCRKCGKSFIQPASLKRHTRMHTGGVNPPLHVCNVCGDVFPTQHSLNNHLKVKDNLCVGAKMGYRPLETMKKPAHCSLSQSRPYRGAKVKPKQEPASPRSDSELLNQTDNDVLQTGSSDHNTRTNSCEQTISKVSKLPPYKRSQTETGTNVCVICNKSFRSLDLLKKHLVVHAEHTTYKCNNCGSSFKNKDELKKHIVLHVKKGKHMCDECGKTFIRPVDLRQHILSHTGEKPHVCDCGSSFAKLYSLKKHKLIVHEGARPYKCDVCAKCFTDRGVLKRHAVVHSEVRAYKCNACGKSFKEDAQLKRHTRIHTGEKPYACHECGKSFNDRGTLKTHLRVHTGEKPYTCDVCSKSFADLSNMRVHTQSHIKKKPHRCDICGKEFALRTHLIDHVVVHIL